MYCRFQRHVHTYRILPDTEGLLAVQVSRPRPFHHQLVLLFCSKMALSQKQLSAPSQLRGNHVCEKVGRMRLQFVMAGDTEHRKGVVLSLLFPSQLQQSYGQSAISAVRLHVWSSFCELIRTEGDCPKIS